MHNKPAAFIGSMGVLVLIVIVATMSPGAAVARQDPTPPPLGDFVIPTSTPGGQPEAESVEIPTATPGGGGGFVIPTSTPNGAAPVQPGLPPLSDDDLIALNLQPGDVPADFAASQEIDTFSAADLSASIRDSGYGEVADQFDRIIETFGWQNSIGVTYTSCQPSVPISEIYSEVAQLGGVDAARAFFEDADVEGFFGVLGYSLEPASTVHGWRATLPPEAGVCFEQEAEYVLFFEYWGMFLTVSMVADANTDPGLVFGLLDQLAPMLVAKVDAFAPEPIPPTPAPGTGAGSDEPTPKPTQASLMPTQAAVPPTQESLVPTQAAATRATLQDIQAVMPTLAETGLPVPPFQRNSTLSGIQAPEQLVATMNEIGFTMLAIATAEGAQRDNMIGVVTEVWDTGSACPETLGISLEIDITVFDTARGATTNLNDQKIQAAWLTSGIITSIQPRGEGYLASGTFQHNCGLVTLYNHLAPYDRFVISVSGIIYAGADEAEIINSLDVLSGYMVQKIEQAGLQ